MGTSLLLLPQCLLDADGTAPVGTGGGGVGGEDQPTCVPACVPSAECLTSQCIDGACVEKPAPPPTMCGENMEKFCDGAGACKLPRGEPCALGDECLSDNCIDGFCCATDCNETCKHCNAPGLEGECEFRTPGDLDEDTCEMVACDGLGSCAPGEASWAWAAGDGSNDDAITAVAAAPDGSSWVALQFDGTTVVASTTYNSDGKDVVLVKLSNTGAVLNSVKLGGAGDELVTKLITDADGNVYAGGYFDDELIDPAGTLNADGVEDGFVVSFDSNAAHRWTRPFTGASDDRVYDLVALQGGGIAAAGGFEGVLTVDGATLTNLSLSFEDGFVVVLDSGGNRVWLKGFASTGSTDIQVVSGLCQNPSTGELYALGTFDGEIGLDSTVTAKGSVDLFVAQLDMAANGNVVSSFTLGNDSPQESRRIGCLPDGGLALTGHFHSGAGGSDDLGIGMPVDNTGSADIFAAIVEADGTLRQRLIAGGSNAEDRLQGLVVDAAGNITVAGLVRGAVTINGVAIPVTGSGAVLAAKYTATGSPLWVRGFDSTGFDGADAVATNADGLVWIGGLFEDPLTFTPGTNATPPMISSQGGEDGFVVRLSP